MQLEHIVETFIARHKLLEKGKKYIVALSGGADSVALLVLLNRMGYDVEAAHCNFNLRGEESERDEQFCRSLCNKLDIALHIAHFDTRTYAQLHKVSIEMAARELRYSYFENLCRDIAFDGICVAHHNDDNVETMFINLVRGTGLHGLTGMSPRNGNILRPLLCTDRYGITRYLEQINQNYVTDSTNLTDDITRNKIRLNIIPQLRQINASATDSISKTMSRLQEAAKVFDAALAETASRITTQTRRDEAEGIAISTDKLKQCPSPEYTLFYILKDFGFTPAQIEQIAANTEAEPGRRWTSATHTIVTDRSRLLVEPTLSNAELNREMRIPEEGVYIFGSNKKIVVNSGTIDSNFAVSKSPQTVHLDKAEIHFPLTIRHLRRGDRFAPFGMKGMKQVSDYLTDRKRTFFDKQHQLVITDATEKILWLVGERTDNRFRISNYTRQYLELQLKLNT